MNQLKQKYIDRAQMHYDADEIVQGKYWENGKGCCVGCLAHANENAHVALQEQTNIPEWLSRVADTIHEGLTKEESKPWPVRFINAVPEQIFTKEWSELEIDKRIKAPFLIMVLKSTLDTFDHDKFPDVKSAIDGSIALWQRGDIGSDEWEKAARAAAWAADAARAAAWDAGAAAADAAADAAAEFVERRQFGQSLYPRLVQDILLHAAADDDQFLVVLGIVRNHFRRRDGIVRESKGVLAFQHVCQPCIGRTLHGDIDQAVFGHLHFNTGLAGFGAEVLHFMHREARILRHHHGFRGVETLVQALDGIGFFSTVHELHSKCLPPAGLQIAETEFWEKGANHSQASPTCLAKAQRARADAPCSITGN